MGNRKIIFCVILFLVIFFFGILAPDIKDKNVENNTYTTTSESVDYNGTSENLTQQAGQAVLNDVIATQSDADDNTQEDPTTTEIKQSTEEVVAEDDYYVFDDEIEEKIDAIIENMSLEEKVGQIFFIKNDGRFDEAVIAEYPVGGVILFKGDFNGKTADKVKEDIADLQNASDIPLLIGVDEEGGTVVRISNYSNLVPTKFQSPRSLYNSGGYEAIENDTVYKSEVLLSYGINVNFAPVCDVSYNSGDFIYRRAFGENVNETCAYVSLVVETMNENNMGSVMKHFPGYGDNGDSHKSIIRDSRSYEQFKTVDFLPFKAGIESGGWCILVSHNIVECIDDEMPASLSKKVHNVLREDLSFGGVIITDDMMMSGVADLMTKEEAAVQAFLAGNDMILSTDYQIQYNAVLEAAQNGEIKEEQLDESIRRILRWKYTLGLLDI